MELMGKLSDELPIINVIKREMKKEENFTKDQVRDFERRVGRTRGFRVLESHLGRRTHSPQTVSAP